MMKTTRRSDNPATRRSAFTLMEALIAITILLVIILATSKIFSGVSDVTTAGQANADIMQEVAAIERQMRQDFERLSGDGFIVIQSRAVRNAINDGTNSNPDLWLDPTRGPDEFIRSDQVMFFTQGIATTQVYAPGAADNRKPQAVESRVYWGHGFQLGDFADSNQTTNNEDVAQGFAWTGAETDLPPWYRGPLDTIGNGTIPNFFQPRAYSWTLARQAVLLAHDGGSRQTWGTGAGVAQGISAEYLWDAAGAFGFDNLIRNGRVDAASSRLGEVRQYVYREPGSGNVRSWGAAPFALPETPAAMTAMCRYPRAERKSPTMFRADQATSVSTVGSAVSDFMVEWTYESGTGFTLDPLDPNTPYQGVLVAYAGETPWFGLSDSVGLGPRNVHTLAEGVNDDSFGYWVDPRGPVFPQQFEQTRTFGSDVYEYSVVFGLNQTRPLNDNTSSGNYAQPWNNADLNQAGNMAFTPWPSALRITMRVHDPRATLQQGRQVQFIVNLPKRAE